MLLTKYIYDYVYYYDMYLIFLLSITHTIDNRLWRTNVEEVNARPNCKNRIFQLPFWSLVKKPSNSLHAMYQPASQEDRPEVDTWAIIPCVKRQKIMRIWVGRVFDNDSVNKFLRICWVEHTIWERGERSNKCRPYIRIRGSRHRRVSSSFHVRYMKKGGLIDTMDSTYVSLTIR